MICVEKRAAGRLAHASSCRAVCRVYLYFNMEPLQNSLEKDYFVVDCFVGAYTTPPLGSLSHLLDHREEEEVNL